jgi:TnpA family transposase
MIDWLSSPALRRRCHAGLNKSEQRHYLAQEICTFNQGRIADRGTETQQFRASGLNLVIAAIVYWNSPYIADTVAHLQGKEHWTTLCWRTRHCATWRGRLRTAVREKFPLRACT